MSSNTTFSVAPQEPPSFVNDMSGAQAVAVTALGPGGGKLLRTTLAELALTGGPAGHAALTGWRADPDDATVFVKALDAHAVEVRAGEVIHVRYRHAVTTVDQPLTADQRERQSAEFRRAANRVVNTVLAHAVTGWVAERVRESLPVQLRTSVRQKQTVALTPSGDQTYRGQIYAFGERHL